MLVRIRRTLLFFCALISVPVFALDLATYRFSDSYRYSLLDDSLQEKFPGNYVLTASYGHIRSPFYYSDRNLTILRKAIIDYNNVLTLGGSWYINNNISVGIDVGAVNNRVFDKAYNTFTDSIVKARLNVLRTDGFSLSLNPQIFLPTGDRDNFTTQGSVGAALSVVGEQKLGEKLHLLASLGALSSKNNEYAEVDHRQLLLTQLGLSYDVMEKLNVNLEARRNFPMVNDKLQDEGKYFATAKHKTGDRFSTFGGAGLSGFDKVERRTWSFFFGIKFHEKNEPVRQEQEMIHVKVAAPVREEPLNPAAPIFFRHDRYDLEATEIIKLNRYVEFIREHDGDIGNILLEGHASKIGPSYYNLVLSQKRARTIKDYLVDHGVEKEKISTIGHGEDFPQDKVEGKNRNVRFTFSEKRELL